jgi:hypothetical protein
MTNIDDGETSQAPETPKNSAVNDPPAAVDRDAEAAAFDQEPDHGLRVSAVREAWAARLRDWLPHRARTIGVRGIGGTEVAHDRCHVRARCAGGAGGRLRFSGGCGTIAA